MTNLKAAVYIPSLEASDIYSHIYRNQPIFLKFVGMIPSSLELQQLIKTNLFNVKENKRGKRTSSDMINVQFKTKVRCGEEIKENYRKKIETTENQIIKLQSAEFKKKKDQKRIEDKINKKKEYIKSQQQKMENVKMEWKEMNSEKLRELLYDENGFTLNITDYNTGEIVDSIKLVVYKRSTAKSRTGKVLMIRDNLHDMMINWSRMGIDFNNKPKIDMVSLLAYESLVGSSISNMIKIETKNILVIDDVYSIFEQDVNLISVGDDDILTSKSGKADVTQNLFDGQSLLDEQYYEGSKKSMILLRSHFFKSAAFRCSIQEFLKDYAKENNIDFNTWKIDNLGGTIDANMVHMITTASSIKSLKFSKMLGTKEDMWKHFCKVVDDEGSLFGIVKEEKESKLGVDDKGKPIQQMSYQMLNSLPCTDKELSEIATYEYNYVKKLKNDMNTFLEYMADTAEITNGNNMMIDLYKHNPKIAHTKMFRDWKSSAINKYVDRVKTGKVKIANADYCVLLGNPMEMLAKAVGNYDENVLALKDNQVYTKMFQPFGDLLAGFRNPHTSPSNCLSVVNTDNKLIEKYFPNISKNIVIVNCVKHALQDILSSADFDSDSMLLTNMVTLADLAKKCKDQYKVCINNVPSDPTTYTVNNESMAEIDNSLSESQKIIGQTTNISQLIVSNVWDTVKKGKECKDMWDKLECLTVLSGLCIDLAKRMPKLNIKLQISDAKRTENMLKYRPYWWMVRNKEVAQKGTKKLKEMKESKIKSYDCPMDFLYNRFDKIGNAPRLNDVIAITEFISDGNAGDASNGQMLKILDILDELAANISHTHKKEVDKEEKKMLVYERNELTSEATESVSKFKIKHDSMYAIVMNIINNQADNNTIRLFNILYQSKKSIFLNTFKKK